MNPIHISSVTADKESMHARLRCATLEQHRRLDRGLAYVVSDQLSLPRYVNCSPRSLVFTRPLEETLARWQRATPPLRLPLMPRADLLRRDLRVFDRATEHLPSSTDRPPITTIDRVAGAIYVLEGASLGAQMIARGLSRSLGIGPENGAAFFTGLGAETSARWKHVLVRPVAEGKGVLRRSRPGYRCACRP
jgi:heme oxygenase